MDLTPQKKVFFFIADLSITVRIFKMGFIYEYVMYFLKIDANLIIILR